VSRADRIHNLFNELHRELGLLNDEVATEDKPNPTYGIACQVDAAHHDFTNITLEEVA